MMMMAMRCRVAVGEGGNQKLMGRDEETETGREIGIEEAMEIVVAAAPSIEGVRGPREVEVGVQVEVEVEQVVVLHHG